jgi:hypothetical protein
MNVKSRGAMSMAIKALTEAMSVKDRKESLGSLDAALRFLSDVIFLEDIHPLDPGITIDIIPVIIQLKLASRGIQLSRGKDL